MAELSEATVQRHAQVFLERYYRRVSRGRRFFSQIEVTTKSRYGSKRADGLLVFRRWLSGTYVVSMEAKSRKTLRAIRPETDWRRWLRNCGLLAASTAAIITLFSHFFYPLSGALQWLFPLNFGLLLGLLYGLISRSSYRHQMVRVVNQIGQYPANEQWLAFSDDSYRSLSEESRSALLEICRYRGIGVLLVRRGGRIEVVRKPLRTFKFWKDYLVYYQKEGEIRRALS